MKLHNGKPMTIEADWTGNAHVNFAIVSAACDRFLESRGLRYTVRQSIHHGYQTRRRARRKKAA